MKKTKEKLTLKPIFTCVTRVLGNHCSICGEKLGYLSAWVVHHRDYVKGEKIWKDFKNRLEYYQYLLPIIIESPERFRLMHSTHHYQAEMRWAIYKPKTFFKMVELASEINRRKFPNDPLYQETKSKMSLEDV